MQMGSFFGIIFLVSLATNFLLQIFSLWAESRKNGGLSCTSDNVGVVLAVTGWIAEFLFIFQKDLVIYEMNVRAFTADEFSGQDPSIRGSYLDVIEMVLAIRSFDSGTGILKSDAGELRERCLSFLLEQLKVLLLIFTNCGFTVYLDHHIMNMVHLLFAFLALGTI
ncbi:hypothetical protein ACSBR2_012356 [Camellia fascicularis]